MTTRREFVASMAASAALGFLRPSTPGALASTPAGGAVRHPPAQTPLLAQQQNFVDLRLGMLSYFNMSTFQGREWATPGADAEIFAPTRLDTDQWAIAAKSANMTWGALTVKHHDGFCLWPTATDSTSVRHAGVPDVVRAYVDSFRRQGLKVGFQFSMLDQRQRIERYAVTPERIALVKEQLRELLTNYGDIAVIIFEGWNNNWGRLTYTEVPFHEIYAHIKSVQPNCLVCELNGTRFPARGLYYSDLNSYKWGSGQALPVYSGVPGCAVLNLNGTWFWRQADINAPLLAAKTAVEEWIVPFNDRQHTVLFNAPVSREGRLAPNLVQRLAEIGRLWKHPGPAARLAPHVVITTPNLAARKPIRSTASADAYGPDMLNDENYTAIWGQRGGETGGWVEVDFGAPTSFNTVAFDEPARRFTQYPAPRIAAYRFKRWDGAAWVQFAAGTAPPAGAVQRVPRTTTERIRFEFDGLRDTVWLSELGVYDEPASA